MKMKVLIFLLGFLQIFDCFADEQRIKTRFESQNGEFFIQIDRRKWVVKDKTGKPLYKINDYGFKSMTIFLSNNGQNLVVIDDYMEGNIIEDRNVLWFYNKGKLSKKYKLTELIKDTCNAMMTVWHTDWCLIENEFLENQNKFSISTYEFSELVFDLNTGQLLSNNKPDGFDEETIIVYGEFRKENGEEVSMKIKKYVYGPKQLENMITFRTNYYGNGMWYETVMIKNGIDITPKKYRSKFLINKCSIE